MRSSTTLCFAVALAGLTAASLPAVAKTYSHSHTRAHKVAHHTRHTRRAPIRMAPADEYFGRQKMSILGIRNQLHDLGLRLSYAPEKSEDILGSAAWVEDALHDWEHKYPTDPWLPKNVYDLTSLYARVHTAHGHAKASYALNWLLHKYGNTHYGRLARLGLKQQIVYNRQ
jgi:hypothetical protein